MEFLLAKSKGLLGNIKSFAVDAVKPKRSARKSLIEELENNKESENLSYSYVYDNVNYLTRKSHQSIPRENHMYNGTVGFVIVNRIAYEGGSVATTKDAESLDASHFKLSDADREKLHDQRVRYLERVLTHSVKIFRQYEKVSSDESNRDPRNKEKSQFVVTRLIDENEATVKGSV